jgi:hypothetical protein
MPQAGQFSSYELALLRARIAFFNSDFEKLDDFTQLLCEVVESEGVASDRCTIAKALLGQLTEEELFETAGSNLQAISEQSPEYADAVFVRAISALGESTRSDDLELFDQAIRLFPQVPGFYYLRGQARYFATAFGTRDKLLNVFEYNQLFRTYTRELHKCATDLSYAIELAGRYPAAQELRKKIRGLVIPISNPTYGLLSLCFAWPLLACSAVSVGQLSKFGTWRVLGGWQLAGLFVSTVLGFVFSQLLMSYARGQRTDHGENVLVEDSRSPIAYLRSFSRDEELVAPFFFAPAKNEEEELARLLNPIGPVIAVGKPGDDHVPPGAHRIYMFAEDWKERVESLLTDAVLVVLRLDLTEGLQWEVSKCREIMSPDKILLFLGIEGEKARKAIYESFRNRFLNEFELPDYERGLRFVSFDDAGHPILLKAPKFNIMPHSRQSLAHALLPLLSRFDINTRIPGSFFADVQFWFFPIFFTVGRQSTRLLE